MKKELELWKFVAGSLERNESVMLLVVAESFGSSPGRQGFKMAVAADDLSGSIGGGVMEVNLVEQAKLKIQDEKLKTASEIVEQNHKRNVPNPSGMICSGRQTVLFYKLNPQDLPIVHEIIFNLKKHQSKFLRITADSFVVIENASDDFGFKFEQRGETSFLYEEKLGCKNRLFIVGGGHCALAVSELMSKMDFHITLFDDRSDLNTLAKNKFVHEKKIIESYENIDDFISSGANHFVVVMTIGYKSDETVIRRLFDKNFRYFGVLGSRVKMATLLKQLAREGFSSEKLNEIRTPIGIRINSRTPEEIAVSIAAEIIAVKNGIEQNT